MSLLTRLLGTERWPSLLADPAPAPPPAPKRQRVRIQVEEDEEPAPAPHPLSLTPIQELQLYGFIGWRQEQVKAAQEGFEGGSMMWPHLLYLAMQRDPVFSHGVETRVINQQETDLEWVKHPDLPQALFDEWVDRWPDACDDNEQASATRQRICLGVAPAQARWTAARSRWWLRRVETKDTGNLLWYPMERRYKIVTLSDGQLTIDDDGVPWILFKERASAYPHLLGACRSLADYWWLKHEGLQLRSNYGRFCGIPVKKVSTPAEQRNPTEGAPDVKSWLKKARDLLGNGVFQALKFPPNWETVWDLEFLEAKGEAHRVFDRIIDDSDDAMTLRLLGAMDNTRGGSQGSRARAEVHERQSNRYLGSDCKATARVYYRLARLWCQFNQIPQRLAPVPKFANEPPEDIKDGAMARQANADALTKFMLVREQVETKLQEQEPGAQIDMRQLLVQHRIPLREPGDRRAQAASPDPAALPSPEGDGPAAR